MTKVSILIPTLNSEKTLPLLLSLINKSNINDIEVLIVDGGSRDRTLEIAKIYGAKIIGENVRNIALARNILLEKARGEILIFLDSDVLIPPWFIDAHLQAHSIYPEIDILSSTVFEVKTFPELDELMKIPKPNNIRLFPAKRMADFVQMALSLKRKIANVVKYDIEFTRAHEDGYYFHAAIRAGLKIYKTSDIMAFHYKPAKRHRLISNTIDSFKNASFPLFLKKFGLWYLKANIGHTVKFFIRMILVASLILIITGETRGILIPLVFYYIIYPIYRRHFDPYILISELSTGVGEIYLLTSYLMKKIRFKDL
jgi:glycosyltransferase involved in cell wall biosynthesis